MNAGRTVSEKRKRTARAAVDALGGARAERQRLSVQCRHSHHVAGVYETDAGLAYVARTGPHSHGSKDFVDTGHHGGGHGIEIVDLVQAPGAGDALPGWCDCGPQVVSRAAVLASVRAGEATLRLG